MRRTSSISSLSSNASSSEEETMQIFVKDVSGRNTIPLSIPPSTTISTLRSMLSLRSNIPPAQLRLVHAGTHLSSSSHTLNQYSVPPNSTLHMALPMRGGGPKKIRCQFKDCRDAAQRIVGDCGFCEGKYCGKHRLLEDHKCVGLEDCKEEERGRNAQKLESERTVAIRGI